MKIVRWINSRKNNFLKQTRGVGFEEITEKGKLLEVREHPRYSEQRLFIYDYQNYTWVVVVGKNPDRFITLYKSRKIKKEFGL